MSKGRFGIHGGQYIPETLMNAMLELDDLRDALIYSADMLSAEHFDFCVHECPSTAIYYCADKLTEEQLDYCVHERPAAALEYCPERLTK